MGSQNSWSRARRPSVAAESVADLFDLAEHDAAADPAASAVRFDAAEEEVDQRRLPGAVRPDDRDAITEADKKGTILLVIEMGDRNLEPDAGPPAVEGAEELAAEMAIDDAAAADVPPMVKPKKKGLLDRLMFWKK